MQPTTLTEGIPAKQVGMNPPEMPDEVICIAPQVQTENELPLLSPTH